jgi:hypothetical protein
MRKLRPGPTRAVETVKKVHSSELYSASADVCVATGHEAIPRDLIQAVRAKTTPFNACFSRITRNERTVGRLRVSVCAFSPSELLCGYE